MLAILGAWFAACSSVPSRHWPRYDERTVVLDYPVQDGRPVQVPTSGPGLTILEFSVEPQAAEHFTDGHRWLQPPADCSCLTVRCRYRVYADGDTPPPVPTAMFPGASLRQLSP